MRAWPHLNTAINHPIQSDGVVLSHRHNNFDLMRLLFASLVLLSHSTELMIGNREQEPLTQVFHTISFGELGVDCFFILSGFLITASWMRDPHALNFLRKRVFRIYPGYAVAFLVSVYAVGAIGAGNASSFWHDLHPLSLLRQAAFLQPPATAATFTAWPYPLVNGALWTIQYEFACYLLVLVLGASGLLNRHRVLTLLWAAALLCFAAFRITRMHDPRTGAIDDGGHILPMIRFLPMFLSGACIYHGQLHQYAPPKWLLAVTAITLLIGLSGKVTAEIAVASVGAYLLIWCGHIPLNLNLLRRLPDISYGVYLYGWPLQKLVIASKLVHTPVSVFVLSWGLALLAGFTSWHLIEAPALRVSDRLRARQPALPWRPRLFNAWR